MADADPIRAAIEQLRAEYAEIPEWQRAQRWHASDLGTDIAHWWLEAGGQSIANFGQGIQAQIDAERAARMCSPHVTEALIALLTAIDDVDLPDALDAREIEPDGLRQIQSAAAALATAITRRPE